MHSQVLELMVMCINHACMLIYMPTCLKIDVMSNY